MNATTTMTNKKYISSYDEYLLEMSNVFVEAVKNIPELVPDIMEKVEEIKFMWNMNDASNGVLFAAAAVLVSAEKAYEVTNRANAMNIFESAIDSCIDSIDNEHFTGDDEYRAILRWTYITLKNNYRFHFGEGYRDNYVPKF